MLEKEIKDFEIGWKLAEDLTLYFESDEDNEFKNNTLFTRYDSMDNNPERFEVIGFYAYTILNKKRYENAIEKNKTNENITKN